MRPADRTDLLLDTRLVTGAVLTALAVALPAAAFGAVAQGVAGACGALVGVAAVGLNGALAAWVSARTGRTRRGIGVGWVLFALPARMALLAAVVAAAVGPLGLPAAPVVLAVCGGEICVVTAQSWLVLRGPAFVGPLDGKA